MLNNPIAWLGGLTAQQFLDEYWQKKPLLIRNALPEWIELISGDELAGLALESQVESRIVLSNNDNWELKHGPFGEYEFDSLPETQWTLLVQAVDHYVPAGAELLEHFNFIPHWRIDDLMVSYAVPGGSVGPHFDYYDVFLLQGMGRREWRLGQMCDEDTPLLDNAPLKLLSEFQESARWVLNPGDMLYVPPGLAHWGIAKDECTTYSIGFRALSQAEFSDAFSRFLRHTHTDDQRYSDPGRRLQSSPGELTAESIAEIRSMFHGLIDDEKRFQVFLGELLSAPKYDRTEIHAGSDFDIDELSELLKRGFVMRRNEASRFLFTDTQGGTTNVFVDGQQQSIGEDCFALARYICNFRVYDTAHLLGLVTSESQLVLLQHWLKAGYLYIEASEDEDAT